MSSIPPETLDILKEVVHLTEQGRLSWDRVRVPHETGGVYVSFASGELELCPRPVQTMFGGSAKVVDVSIRNDEGLVIYSFTVGLSEELYDELSATYDSAWKQAIRAPETLSKLREELAGHAR